MTACTRLRCKVCGVLCTQADWDAYFPRYDAVNGALDWYCGCDGERRMIQFLGPLGPQVRHDPESRRR